MSCPHCESANTRLLTTKTELGYRQFYCRACRRKYNERTGTAFNFLEYPTDLVMLVVFWRLRYALSLRDVAELCLLRSVTLTHETVRDWEQRFAPYLTNQLKRRRKGKCSMRWLSMKRISKRAARGSTIVVPLIVTATWWTR